MRQIININKDWYFTKEIAFPQKINNLKMEKINLPHTWNNIDGTDGGNDYYRGKCIYYKNLNHIDLRDDEEIYLEFDGVNMSIRVFLNNHLVGEHRGGYSRFRFNITKYLNDKDNILVCYVDNSASREIYPQKADFTFYGGIYRDVNLIKVNKSHFQLDYFGGEGLKITPHVDGEVEIEVFTSNSNNHSLLLEIYDNNEELVAKANAIIEDEYSKQTLFVKNVHLWNGVKDPYLYKVVAKLDTDIVSASFGFRSFRIDPQKGFYLNDKPYDLIGVSRHQDRALVGSALTKEMHKEDMDIIKEMGATTIRLAHYQHDQYVYDLADQYGFIIWAEIPYITEHMDEAIENTKSQLQELIIQNYNHPSIIVWGLSNEITVVNGCSPSCYKNHEELNALAHSLDKTRLTTMANLFMLETSSPLVKLPDVRSYNLYFGWYVGEKEENDKWLDEFHNNYPELAIGLSEFGADANPQYQSEKPVKGDYSESYQAIYHEHMLKMRKDRPWIWAMHVWNMFDFAADGRDEGGKKGINQKGLVTFDRKIKKDAFYLYKAYLSNEPFIHLAGKRYVDRVDEITNIKVYTNEKEVSLYVDDVLVETKKGEYVFDFKIKINSEHKIKVVSNGLEDEMVIRKVDKENQSYICSSKMEVTNWFDEAEELNSDYFSIKDKVKDIKAHPVAGNLYKKMMEEAMKSIGDVAQSFVMPKEMQEKMDNMSLEDNLKMAGHMVKPSMIKQLNDALQKIKK